MSSNEPHIENVCRNVRCQALLSFLQEQNNFLTQTGIGDRTRAFQSQLELKQLESQESSPYETQLTPFQRNALSDTPYSSGFMAQKALSAAPSVDRYHGKALSVSSASTDTTVVQRKGGNFSSVSDSPTDMKELQEQLNTAKNHIIQLEEQQETLQITSGKELADALHEIEQLKESATNADASVARAHELEEQLQTTTEKLKKVGKLYNEVAADCNKAYDRVEKAEESVADLQARVARLYLSAKVYAHFLSPTMKQKAHSLRTRLAANPDADFEAEAAQIESEMGTNTASEE